MARKSKNKSLIIHVPHAGTQIPFYDGFVLSDQELQSEIELLTDWYTDDLFKFEGATIIKAPFSRIFCDVERFLDDEKEIMSRFGMGVLYEKSDDGRLMREVSPALRNRIIQEYYVPHHIALQEAVENQLNQFGKALIIDAHSFPNTPFQRDLNQETPRPDFNIGIDAFHTPQKVIDLCKDFFDSNGFILGINWPYEGTMVPLDYYQKDKRVMSVMLEVNRDLYVEDQATTSSETYVITKEIVQQFLMHMDRFLQK